MVRACARFPGWKVYGRNARLVLEVGEHANIEQPSHFAGSAAAIDGALKVLDVVNHDNDTKFTPKLSTAPDRADTYAGKGKKPLRVLSMGMSFFYCSLTT